MNNNREEAKSFLEAAIVANDNNDANTFIQMSIAYSSLSTIEELRNIASILMDLVEETTSIKYTR